MLQPEWNCVDDYFNEHLSFNDPILSAALAACDAAGMPPLHVSPAQGKLLHLIARLHGSRTILEIGTLGGYSTIWLARALPDGGRVVSLELEEEHARIARSNVARAGLADRVSVLVGPAADSLSRLYADQDGPFDLIFIDADKASCDIYLDWSLCLARPGGIIIIDNVVRQGHVADSATDDESVRGIQRMMERFKAEPRLTATAIQTVGMKGYDGFCLALVE